MENKIYKGAVANDKTGTPARIAADIINQNFEYLEGKIVDPDRILTYGTKSLLDDVLTVNLGWSWRINRADYANPVNVNITFPYASAGFQRLDRLVFNTSNTITRIQGDESASNPVAEPIPANTVDYGVVLVTDLVVGEVSPSNSLPAKTTPLVNNDKIVINDSQDSEKTKTRTWQEVSSQITEGIFIPDTVIRTTEPTRVGNEFTFPVDGYEVLLNKTRRSNTNQLKVTPVAATTDYKRVDVVYFKPDNTLAAIQGVESTSVAGRPEVPVGSIAIYFINVFGATIESPTPIDTEISIQNEFGVQQFTVSDYLRFENVTHIPSEKKIRIDPLAANTAFISAAGNDTTALLNNSQKPFKTLDALIIAVKTRVANGLNWKIEFLTGGVFEVINCNDFNFNVETNLNVEVVFKKNASWHVYSIFKGANLTLTINFSQVTNTFAGLVLSGILDWDINTFKYIGSETGVTKLLRGVSFGGFVNSLLIKNIIVSGGNFEYNSEIFLINNTNDYDFKIYNYNNIFGARLLYTTTTKNSSWTFYNCTLGGSATSLEVNTPENVLLRIGNINTTIRLDVSAKNVELLNGTIKNLTFLGLKKLKGKAKITYDTWNNSYYGRIVLTGVNRALGEFCLFEDVDLEFIQGVSYPGNHLSLITAGNHSAIKFKNTKIKVTGANWNPALINAIIQDSNKGTLLYFEGDNDFQLKQYFLEYKSGPYGDDSTSVDLSTFTEATNRGLITFAPAMVVTNRADFDITDLKKEGIDYPNSKKSTPVRINSKNTIINRSLDSSSHYIIDEKITLLSGEYIRVPAEGLNISGNGFNVSGISKNVALQSIFISESGGSGDFISKDIVYNSGIGSVFNIVDSDGTHAIELNDLNFQSCSSIGKIKGYRQFTGTTCGVYSCGDGIQLSGNWNGFKLTNSNIMNFLSGGKLIKKDVDTLFSNRLYLDLNFSGQTGSMLSDFDSSNFASDELFQINNTLVVLNGSKDAAVNTPLLLPNISPNDPKAKFTNNLGITNSAVKFQDLKSPDGSIWRLTVNDSGAPTWTELV